MLSLIHIFAFLSPALLVISKYGYEYALGGFVVLGIAGMCVALIVRQCGTDWIDIVLPTAAMGPVVALIGLELAGNAASTAGLLDEKVDPKNVIVFCLLYTSRERKKSRSSCRMRVTV